MKISYKISVVDEHDEEEFYFDVVNKEEAFARADYERTTIANKLGSVKLYQITELTF